MARLFTQADAKRLGLPGRSALDIVSGEKEAPRAPHHHFDFEECIYVLSGQGTTFAESGEYPLRPGDTLLMPPGEKHVTRNTGSEPLLLLCFFPVADIAEGTQEPGVAPADKRKTS
jgi:quercetin dioxygenase-like cupin family protein